MNALIRDNGSKTIRQFLSEWKEKIFEQKPQWPTFEQFTQALAEGHSCDVHQLRNKLCADLKVNYEDVKSRRVNWWLHNDKDFDGGGVITHEFTIEFTALTQVNNDD